MKTDQTQTGKKFVTRQDSIRRGRQLKRKENDNLHILPKRARQTRASKFHKQRSLLFIPIPRLSVSIQSRGAKRSKLWRFRHTLGRKTGEMTTHTHTRARACSPARTILWKVEWRERMMLPSRTARLLQLRFLAYAC